MLHLYFRSNIDAQLQKFEKSLEEFYSMCDQVEISLVSLESGKTVLFLNLNVIISNMHIKIYMEIQSYSSSLFFYSARLLLVNLDTK